MEIISMDELHNRMGSLSANDLILDVRSEEEFAEGHVKGARNQPHDQVGEIASELKKYRAVYVHCKMGGRAKKAAESLEQAGLSNIVCVGQGGMQRWMDMGWEHE